MKSISDYKPTLTFGLLLAGPPKSGKTSIAIQFPKPWLADCDNNMGGPVRRARVEGLATDLRYDTINFDDDGKQIEPAKRWTRLVDLTKKALVDDSIQTIVIDSLSAVNDYVCDHILSTKADSREKDKMTISDWIPFKTLFTRYITMCRSYPGKYFIMTAHEPLEKDDATGLYIVRPHIQSKLQDNIAGFFSDVWCTYTEECGGKLQYLVRANPDARRQFVGNSLGLPVKPFVFKWSELQPHMEKGLFKKA